MTPEILPCPFDGTEPFVFDGHARFEEWKCPARTRFVKIEVWNRRAKTEGV